MVGEPLTIDCGANGKPQPDIEMTNEDGELLNGKWLFDHQKSEKQLQKMNTKLLTMKSASTL